MKRIDLSQVDKSFSPKLAKNKKEEKIIPEEVLAMNEKI